MSGSDAGARTSTRRRELEIDIKYEGYVRRQAEMVERFKRLEDTVIPQWVDLRAVRAFRPRFASGCCSVRPRSLGQAARMPGMTPAAISLLAFHLKSRRDRSSDATRDSEPSFQFFTFHVKHYAEQ